MNSHSKFSGTYEGLWRTGRKDGDGSFVSADDSRYFGIWLDDKVISTIHEMNDIRDMEEEFLYLRMEQNMMEVIHSLIQRID